MLSSKLIQTISYINPETGDSARAMSIKWREMDYYNEAGVKRKQSMILWAYSDGTINEFINPVGKLNSTIYEEGNQTFVLDIDPLEEKFATGGRDCRLRLYDLETKELIRKMIPVDSNHPGHSQAIYACVFKKDDPNILISGGWDKTLQIHDVRKGGPVASIFGPDLWSNSIDMFENTILTGSHRGKNPLQTWDLGKRELIQTLEWDYSGEISESSYLNCAAFSHSSDIIVAGGKGGEIKIFDYDDESEMYQMHTKISDFKDVVLCCWFANTSIFSLYLIIHSAIYIFNV